MFEYAFSSYEEDKLKDITCEVYSYRCYGEAKLAKPKELKGIKQAFSVDWIPIRCKCSCFVKDNELWIKHNDLFSKEFKTPVKDIGTPLTYRLNKYSNQNKVYLNKFIYADCWGEIILRNEGWIVYKNIDKHLDTYKQLALRNSVCEAFYNSDFCKTRVKLSLPWFEWEQFIERLLREYKEYIRGENSVYK